ncbi:sporulation protein YpjB [Desertibacillus haloalkaliphilus]|uniref:sporulation protein YpjB n=1 Tax=Desertibacillus haloalkaliphilus TaxID=1328930 RepID=UPI001C268A3C|nr:sporulation protein YpjB [Desertibacillus haloalkaliphilus]MBU8907266.1 sporulation protein YpjB [Desertibacillus haloalkaliphilus]
MRTIVSLFLILLVLFPGVTFAEHEQDNNKWQELNQLADRALHLVKEEKFDEAKQLLDSFSEQFLSVHYNHNELSMNDLRIVTTTYEKAMAAVTEVSASHEDRVMNMTEFRLAIDALSNEHNPLWVKSERSVMGAFSAMKTAANEGDSQTFQHRLNDFLKQYQMIRAALVIDLEPHHTQRLESHIQFVERQRHDFVNDSEKVKHLDVMEEDFKALYQQFQEDSSDPSLLWVIISVGGMIIVSLSYVGWKKYKAEKKKVKVEE